MTETAQRSCVVRSNDGDLRDWLQAAPVAPQLEQYRIAHCGLMSARPPMRIVRTQLSGTFFLACYEGCGEVLFDGTWKTVNAGWACVQPRFITNAVRAKRSRSWKFAWVRYEESKESQAIVSIYSPTFRQFDPFPLKAAIEGLHAESASAASPAPLLDWAKMVHWYVMSFVEPLRGDDRLQRVWDVVSAKLHHHWTLAELAAIAIMSTEHLRRLTIQNLGRSPMQHVTFLRLRVAAELLATTEEKIAGIAQRVGYDNPYAFSDMFQRWSGYRPSVFRTKSRSGRVANARADEPGQPDRPLSKKPARIPHP